MITVRRTPLLLAGVALAAAGLACLVLSATAAAKTTVRDQTRETRALADHPRLDIRRATSAKGNGNLIFTVTMRRAVRPNSERERPGILINTRGDRRSDPEYLVFGGAVYRVTRGGNTVAIGPAQLGSNGRTWTYRFDPGEIPDLGNRFGWAAITDRDRAEDIAPGSRYARGRS